MLYNHIKKTLNTNIYYYYYILLNIFIIHTYIFIINNNIKKTNNIAYLDSQKVTFNEELLWKGKLCSLVSMTFNLSSHKEVGEKFIYLFLEVSQKHIKSLSQTDFWYELFLLIQVQVKFLNELFILLITTYKIILNI